MHKVIQEIKLCARRAKDQIIQDLRLKVNGSNIQCPWRDHEDNTPSAQWHVEASQIYCHVCAKGYDIVDHYLEFHNHSMPQAIIELCKELKIDPQNSGYNPPGNYLKTKKFKSAPENYTANYHKQVVEAFPDELQWFTDKKISPAVARDFFDTEVTKDEILFHHHELNESREWVKCHTKRRKLDSSMFDDGSKEKSIYGGFSCFYGLKTLMTKSGSAKNTIFLCEGQTDALRLASEIAKDGALDDFGVLSVPNGAGTLKQAIENSPTFRKYVNSTACKRLIIIPDADKAGSMMIQQACNYLSNEKLDEKIRWYDLTVLPEIEFRDTKGDDLSNALDILDGNYLRLFDNLEYLPIDNAVEDILYIPEDGLRTGIPTIDYNDGGLKSGRVTLLAGIRGQGKTTLMRQAMVNLAKQKIPIYALFAEGANSSHKRDLQLAITTRNERYSHIQLAGDGQTLTYPERVAIDRYNLEYAPYIKIFDKDVPKGQTIFEALSVKMNIMARRGTKVFFIDNMMQITNNVKASETYIEQKRVITELVNFANEKNVHVFIICHLNKTGESITGAYEQENLVDTILFFQRIEHLKDVDKLREKLVKATGITEQESQQITAIISVQKIRDRGKQYNAFLTWNPDTGRSIDMVYDMRLNRIATHYLELGFDCIKASTIQTEFDAEDNEWTKSNQEPEESKQIENRQPDITINDDSTIDDITEVFEPDCDNDLDKLPFQ